MKRYSRTALPPKFSPHKLSTFPQIRTNIDTIIELSSFKDSLDITHSWKTLEAWLYAIDLFNHGYYWEAHGVVELIWLQFEYEAEDAQFLQGFIQISASLLKLREGNRKAAKDLFKVASEKISIHSKFGLNGKKLLTSVKAFISGKQSSPVEIFLEF